MMKDRLTGRPRGFGFMTLADEAAADRVCSDTHVLDGRQVGMTGSPVNQCTLALSVLLGSEHSQSRLNTCCAA